MGVTRQMLGVLFHNKEVLELQYLIKKEMDDLLEDLNDEQVGNTIKRVLEERYSILFALLRRFASGEECMHYMRLPKQKKHSKEVN